MDQDAHVIRKRAERARAAIAADVDAIGEKLNVKKQAVQRKDELVDQFKEKVGMSHHGEETRLGHEANTALDVVREHPMATLMAGAGGFGMTRIIAAWRKQHSSYPHAAGVHTSDEATYSTFDPTAQDTSNGSGKVDDAKAKVSEVAGSAKERMGDVTGSVKEHVSDVGSKASDLGSTAKERASSVTSTAKERVPSDRRELESSMRSNMTLWGAGAFALGAAVGSLIPASRMERQKFGEVRDNAMDMAKDKADDAKQALEAGLDAAKEHAQEAVSDVKEHAQEAMSEAKETAKDEMKGSSDETSTEAGSSTAKRPGPILGSRDTETATPDSPVPGGPIRPL